MNNKRPININPLTIELPISAKVSITHRIAGILVFLLIPFILFALQQSLSSAEGFQGIKESFKSQIGSIILWTFLAAFLFHLFAGLRHLLMDIHLGDRLEPARKSAWGVFIATLIAWLAIFFIWGRG